MSDWQSRLAGIYGDRAAEQQTRYEAALLRFRALYGAGPVAFYRVPGRVNLIGEHTDYQQGYVLPVALDKDVRLRRPPRAGCAGATWRTSEAAVRAAPVRDLVGDPALAPRAIGPTMPRAPRRCSGAWPGRPLAGMDILVAGEAPYGVPRGAGLSSSSALTVGVAAGRWPI